ncbi:ubiquitin carboxyl-terminal hydrolase 16 isoform X2 [Parasteatoda tepidariorum]|uniref:ubiquitin carboxyl-terminal hydrolase 16 isoform X2 n=1 Tax=Parasteatoda tepidariorum TaxID=114398 RepID=UPI001C72976B|nr:ubiquitin carboxyl-terminal hydrolase 16 isoform X2 [Parasteatoda tepidariorum]
MVKKKSARQKHQKEALVGDTSEEELKEAKFEGKICQHITRGLNFSRVKRNLKAANIALCGGCSENLEAGNDELPEIWLCLQCGNRGCGRVSTHQHAIQHFKTIHSDCHALVLSSSSGVVWCYECDDNVNLQQSRNLRQCVEFLNKSKGTLDVHKSPLNNQPNLSKSVIKEQATTDSKVANVKTENKNKKDMLPSKSCVKGLRNLGNTCFFNAVMQNLNQTQLLFRILEKACALDYVWEVPCLTLMDDMVVEETCDEHLKIPIPRQFPLANSLLHVYKLMNASTSNKNEIVNPSSLFTEISKKCPQFKHFQEQDSHELLRQLLDGVRQDEVKRQKKAILRHFDIANIPVEEVDEDTKKLVKAYSCYASHTLVEKIFGGLFLSTVLCEECKTSSQVFEPFMDMSLPLFEEKHQDNCNQPFLDGGQQKDFEPVRNRKGGLEQDGSNEYILNKPKKENGKPSKHQLRKLKDLAKKEKKKKNKTRRISETNEDLSESEEKLKENDSDKDPSSKEHAAEDEEQETDNTAMENAENLEEIKDTLSCKEKVELKNLSCNGVKNETDVIEISLHSTSVSHANTVNTSETDDVEFNNQTLTDLSKNNDLCKKRKENVSGDCNSVSDRLNFEKCCVTEKLDFDVAIVPNDTSENGAFHSILEDLLVDEIPTQKIPKDLERAMLGENVSEDLLLEKNLSDFTQNHKDATFKPVPETACVLTENFKKLNVSLESDERMQTLGLQVKEVRIRRDSDRQGSILNSSLSPDEETILASCESQEDTCDNENEEKWSCNFSESQVKEWILKSLFTLKPRVKCDPNECSIDSSLTYFTKPELLTGSNKFRCEKCTEIKISKSGNKKDVAYSNASKQFLIFSPPAILTLHLKRFQQVGMSLRKVNRFVEFPSVLDIAPYCSSACLILPHMSSVKDEILYSLYGVVEHSGRMSSGHYTAYVKATKRTLNETFMCHLPLAQCDLEQLLQKFSKINTEKTVHSDTPRSSIDCRWYYVSDAHVREVDEAQVMKCQAYLLFYERIK